MPKIKVDTLGDYGVNVDKNPLALRDGEFTKAQNAIRNPIGTIGGIKNRPGLRAINTASSSAIILGGIGVPLQDQSANGTHFVYIGRGPVV
jgi:hypothetical protein